MTSSRMLRSMAPATGSPCRAEARAARSLELGVGKRRHARAHAVEVGADGGRGIPGERSGQGSWTVARFCARWAVASESRDCTASGVTM